MEKLRALYDEALAEEDVIGLSIGTRPDCVPDETLALIRFYAERFHVWLEFGLQSIHDRTLGAIHRGHDAATFRDAVRRTGGGPILICVHIIVGLPSETREEILETARAIAELVIQRLTADGYREILLGPAWAGNKLAVLNAIDRELETRDSWQGNRWEGTARSESSPTGREI